MKVGNRIAFGIIISLVLFVSNASACDIDWERIVQPLYRGDTICAVMHPEGEMCDLGRDRN